MCSHYEALRQWENYVKFFHVTNPRVGRDSCKNPQK